MPTPVKAPPAVKRRFRNLRSRGYGVYLSASKEPTVFRYRGQWLAVIDGYLKWVGNIPYGPVITLAGRKVWLRMG
jgi:hypothetical protein